jgi:O-antigen/teichoic acid export membrane protein
MIKKPSGVANHRQVRRNAIWNIVGQGLPLAVAVLFIPRLIAGMGADRFGALTLVWTFLTYFSLFDLGLARAITQLLAGREGKGESDERDEADLIWTAFGLSIGLGVVAAALLFCFAPLLTSKLLRLQGALNDEMILSLRMLAVVLPLLIHSLMLRGILEAKRRFDISNLIRIPLGVFTYVAPVAVLPFSRSLPVIVGTLLAGRTLAWVVNFWLVFRIMPNLRHGPTRSLRKVRQLLRFGGWVTFSNLITPLTDNADRFLITSMLSISAVAYYTTPSELVGKLWIVSLGMGGALFPEFATRFQQDRRQTETLYVRSTRYIVAVLFPFLLLATAYAHEGLTLWLNPAFADAGTPVVQWFAIAVFVGGFRLISYYLLVGAGRPHIATWNDLFELLLYAAMLYGLIKMDGLRGAAIASTLRMVSGCLVYLFFSGRILEFRPATYLRTFFPLALGTLFLLAFHIPMAALPKALLAAATLILYAILLWRFVLEDKDKRLVLNRVRIKGTLSI